MKITAPNISKAGWEIVQLPADHPQIPNGLCIPGPNCIIQAPHLDTAAESHARFLAASKKMAEALLALLARASASLDQSATHDGLQNCDALAKARSALTAAGYTFGQ